MLQLAVLSLCLSLALGVVSDWSTKPYTVKGKIILPYGDIIEPFEAWIDPTTKRSRIDYYNGMNSILYLNGPAIKIIPSIQEGVEGVTLFDVTGRMKFQYVLPDIAKYTLISNEVPCVYKSKPESCYLYRYVEQKLEKVNTYEMHLIEDRIPVLFNWTGYDNLFGSHYDHYIFEYRDYEQKPIPNQVYEDYLKYDKINTYTQTDVSQSELDPMSEFMGEDSGKTDQDINNEFEVFKKKYSKSYNTYFEHESRKSIFRQARRYIHSKNRENLGFKLAINHLADHTDDELRNRYGLIFSGIGEDYRLKSSEVPLSDIKIPNSINWTEKGAVNPPKDQGICGSCWSFGVTGTLEGSYFIKHGVLLDLSEQSLIDCTWNEGNNGCDGGHPASIGKWLLEPGMDHCVVTRDEYASAAKEPDSRRGYLMADGICHLKVTKKDTCVKITNFTVLPQGDVNALKQFTATNGPISVGIDANHYTFKFYSEGVLYEPDCKNGIHNLDHAVLVVGYGTENGQDYWLVKNSWSTYWGDQGYVKMARKDNNCGVATNALFFTL